MTENPITATELMPVDEAMSLLYELDVRHLPVVRDKELLGIISDRDLQSFRPTGEGEEIEAAERAHDANVGSLMNTDPVRADPETSVRELTEMMLTNRVGAIPITDGDTGDLVGIVSYVDLLRVLQETLEPAT